MVELTLEQCSELEKRSAEKLGLDPNDAFADIISKISIRATITTIREYERMQTEK